MKRKWEIQWSWSPWLSLGIHIDHLDPSITFHLPGIIVIMGRCKQPGFKWKSEHENLCARKLMMTVLTNQHIDMKAKVDILKHSMIMDNVKRENHIEALENRIERTKSEITSLENQLWG